MIQMQDADISGTNAITYGDGASGRGSTGLRSTGLYEYVSASSAVVAGAVTIVGSGAGGGLINSYDFSAAVTATHGFRTFQVLRVPQYSSATVTAGLTATAWDGIAHAGGILAVDVAGALNMNGQTINADQLGFKGALGVAQAGGPDANTDYVVASQRGDHGYKGEGIAGTPHFLYDAIAGGAASAAADGYPSGDAARGAPGNAGGGGTDGHPVANDENTGGVGGAIGGQGGLGGNSWNSNLALGGLGGAAFPAAAGRIVLGGGGGSGSRNNSTGFASSGGTGGGIVMIRVGSVAGTGTITANGGMGVTPANDGGGAGGAGGSVLVTTTTGTVNGLTIAANGGNGTDAWPAGPAGTASRHGPGGGGGGGVIITSNALPGGQTSVAGGVHGITTNGPADAYGSTSGNPGAVLTTTPGAIPGSSSGGECLPVLTVAKATSTPNVINTPVGTVATYSITVSNAVNTSPATNVNVADALPTGFTYASTMSVVLSGGATRPATVNPVAGDTNPTFGTFSIPGAGSVVITFTVNIASNVVPGTYNNSATVTYLDPTRLTPTGTATPTYPGGGLDRVTVGIALPDMTIAKSHVDPFVRGSTTSTYTVTATNSGIAPTTGTVTVTDTLPIGLTPTAASGTGWTCPAPAGQTVTCTRANALAAGSSYPPITITVTVLQTAPSSVVNQAVVSGGGETNTANNTASDPTTIISLPGLPNTSAPSLGEAPGPPNVPLPVAAFGLIAAIGAMTVRGRLVRFRRRRRRPVSGALPILLSLVACTLAISPLMTTRPEAVVAPAASMTATVPGTELIGATVVTEAKPAPPVEESFHAAAGSITPTRLRIPSISVDAHVAGVGLLEDGSMAVPDNLWMSAWLSSSAHPGQAGSAVIAGHRGIGTPGLFGHLENVRPGDTIRVSDAGGGELVYQVTRVASLDLSVATQLQVFGPTAQHQLVLITCIGRYSQSTRTYDHRLVVFSRLLPNG
ncbi:MAG: hypothetical protein NVS1B3_07750 [Candidatus Dormibacteraceae bacterium]